MWIRAHPQTVTVLALRPFPGWRGERCSSSRMGPSGLCTLGLLRARLDLSRDSWVQLGQISCRLGRGSTASALYLQELSAAEEDRHMSVAGRVGTCYFRVRNSAVKSN